MQKPHGWTHRLAKMLARMALALYGHRHPHAGVVLFVSNASGSLVYWALGGDGTNTRMLGRAVGTVGDSLMNQALQEESLLEYKRSQATDVPTLPFGA